MKRALTVLIAATMLVFMFTACGGGKSKKTVVQFWGHVNNAWNESHKSVINKFNSSQSDIEVVPTFFPYDDFEAKIQTSLMSGGAGADLYEIWGGWGLDFVASGALSEVPADLVADLMNDCYEPVMGAFQGGGKYYGVPVEFNNEYGGMLVNKPEFQSLGIPYPTTWDEIVNVARRTTVRRGDVFVMRGLDFTTDDTLSTTFLSMILSKGGQYWVNGRIKLTTPEAQEALQILVNWVAVDRLTNTDSATGAQGDEIDGAHFLGQNNAMMVPRGPWVVSMLDEDYGKQYGVDFDFVKFPFYGPTPAFPAETGWSMCVPKDTKVTDAVWQYVRYFLQPDNLLQHNINCAQIPPRKSVAQNPAFVRAVPYMAPLMDILQYGKYFGPFNTDVFKLALRDVYVSLCLNDGRYASVAAALAALETRINTD
ncbi:MAG: extracellular solute-binding protein, partial [Treponema sp.]|nr:extracellular solute-binding protein [Treponema sp.]